MKTVKAIISKLAENNISVYEYKENKKLCGYELNTYTNGGVNQIIFLDFRDTDLNPKNAKDFLQVYNERIKDIDVDDEIEVNRQNKDYVRDFSLTESIKDFTDWKNKLENIFVSSSKTPQQRQFEQVKDKFVSLLAEMEETLKLIPRRGNVPYECQRTNISNQLGGLDMCINGLELEDFKPNDYSGDFKFSYS